MRRLVVTVICSAVGWGLVGCQDGNRAAGNSGIAKGEFPKVMVGVWGAKVTKRDEWGIKFEPDGSISKIVHPLAGPIVLAEGGSYIEGPDPNTYAIFVMGTCEAQYDSRESELDVTIILDHYEMQLPTGILKGRIESYFSGPVSKDGKTWPVELRNYAWLEGAAPPDPNVIEANPEHLVFTKLNVKALEAAQ